MNKVLPGSNKKVISFSLYGNSPKYTYGAVINCILAPKVYPGWLCRFYVDGTVPNNIKDILKSFDHVEVIEMPNHRGSEAMLWRGMTMNDPDVEAMISRDADSWISVVEKVCVDDWLSSGKGFHIIKMHCYHTDPKIKIMGGIYGARYNVVPEYTEWALEYSKTQTYDQGFLATKIYPLVENNMIAHYDDHWDNQGRKVEHSGEAWRRMPPYDRKMLEAVPGIDFLEVNRINAFHCAHCKRTHELLIGGINEHLPPRTMNVLQNYCAAKGLSL
jgi:hypothetical protein